MSSRDLQNSHFLQGLKTRVRQWWSLADQVVRSKAVGTIEYEAEELDHVFGLLVLGMFIGMPSPPIHISMALFPLMEEEFTLMLDKITTAHDPLAELFSTLDID